LEVFKVEAILTRQPSSEKQTLGELVLYKDGKAVFSCKTLELPWKNNQRKVSCIPTGVYDVVFRDVSHSKFKRHYHIKNVPNRTWILIHTGNYYTQIEGCILVGNAYADINKDGYQDVINSRVTLDTLLRHAPDGFKITVKWTQS